LWLVVSLTPLTTKKGDFIVEYLREYEAICKKALIRVSGAQMELFDEKTRGRKSRDRVPLSRILRTSDLSNKTICSLPQSRDTMPLSQLACENKVDLFI
jgi:hypothetical protein